MRLRTIMFCLVFLIVAIGCQPRTEIETEPISSPSPTLMQRSIESDILPVPPTDRVEIPTIILIQPTPRHPVEYETGIPWDDAHMPIFLEVIQTTSMGEKSVQSPTFGVGPAIYFYNPENNVLMLHPTITQKSKTEVLVGVTSILQTPGQVFEKREIVQFPSEQPELLQIVSIDAGTSNINMIYADEAFDLSLGESRTFKQFSGDSNNSNTITMISNHGHITEIQPFSSDGSLR